MSATTDAAFPSRDLIVADIVMRTGIDEPMIEQLVRTFYGRARLDPLIGPIFENKVHDWERHLQPHLCVLVICRADEWPLSRPADGGPSAAAYRYAAFRSLARDLRRDRRDICPPAAAAYFLERARRIADSLELGIAARKGEISPEASAPARTLPSRREANDVR